MSAFLGPIHYWLYKKIQFQDNVTNRVIDYFDTAISNLNLKQMVDKTYGVLPQEPLETVIDEGNIHGWLQEKVSVVEYRLAKSVTEIMKNDKSSMATLRNIFQEYGKDNGAANIENSKEVFKLLNDTLLDGMPCDRANDILSESDDEVVWQRNICVHQQYWDEVGGDINLYYTLRDELIKGMLEHPSFAYEKLENSRYCLKRR